ncbi:MAG: hypothetical protein U0X86_000590 [Wolbachia endosymbiont of Xenopsylla cheopis]
MIKKDKTKYGLLDDTLKGTEYEWFNNVHIPDKTGHEWYDMIPKQRISPKIKELQSNLEVISKKNGFKSSEVRSELEVLKNSTKNNEYSFQEDKNQIKQNYSSKDSDKPQEIVTRESILKQSKRKPSIDPKIQDLQNKLQDPNAHLKEQQKSGSVKSLAAKFESLGSAQESKTDTNRKIGKLDKNPSYESFVEKLNEMNQKNDAGRER